MGRLRLCVLSVVIALPLMVVTASRADPSVPVSASPADVQQALFAAGGVNALSTGTDAPPQLILNKILLQTYQLQPFLDPGTAACEIGQLRSAWDAAVTAGQPSAATFAFEGVNQRLITVLHVMNPDNPPPSTCSNGASPWQGTMDTALQVVSQQALENSASFSSLGPGGVAGGSAASGATGGGFSPSAASLNTLELGYLDPHEVLRDAAVQASLDRQFGKAWNLAWGPGAPHTLNQDIFAGSASLIAENPALQGADTQTLTSSLIGSDGSVASDVSTLTSDAGTAFQDLATVTTTAADSASGGESTAIYNQNNAKIADDRAAASFLAALIAKGSPVQAKFVSLESTEESSMATTSNEWSAQKIIGLVQSGVTIGIDLASQNYVGAVMSALSVFGSLFGGGSTGPSADQQALQQLGNEMTRMNSNILEIGKVMTTDFANIDQEIAAAYGSLNSDLGTIAKDLTTLSSNLETDAQSQYKGIQTIQLQLDQLQANLYALMTDQANGDFWKGVDNFIGWQTLQSPAGQQLTPTSDSFGAANALFSTVAAQDAVGATALDPNTPADGPSFLYGDLSDKFPLEGHIDYLGALVPVLSSGYPPPHPAAWPSGLPNPRWWADGSQAYAELLLENPNYATPHDVQTLQTMVTSEGLPLETGLAHVSSNDDPQGTSGAQTGNYLLSDLLSYYATYGYQSGGSAPRTSLSDVIKHFEQDWLGAQPAPTDGYSTGTGPGTSNQLGLDIWGAPNQTPDWTPTIGSAPGCGGSVALPAVASQSTVVDNRFVNAMRLGLGTYGVSCAATYSNPTLHRLGCHIVKMQFGSCSGYYTATVTVNLTWAYTPTTGGSPVTIATVADGNLTEQWPTATWAFPNGVPPNPPVQNGQDAGPWVQQYWSSSLEAAVQNNGITTYGGQIGTIDDAVRTKFHDMQKSLYTTLVSSDPAGYPKLLQTYGCLTVADCPSGQLPTALSDLNGATAAIDGYLELGMASGLASDNALHSLVFSPSRLLDNCPAIPTAGENCNVPQAGDPPGRILGQFQTAENAPQSDSGANPGDPVLQGLDNAMQDNETQLAQELTKQVSAGSNQVDPLITATVDRLQLAHTVLQWYLNSAPRQLGSIVGTVVQNGTGETGTPAAHLCVQAASASSGAVVETAFTDRQGAYALYGLPAGTYLVSFRDCVKHLYVPQYYTATPTVTGSRTPVAVTAGAPVALVNSVETFISLGGQISGTVTDNSSPARPLPGICVAARAPGTGAQVEVAHTDARGEYLLGSLPPGSYDVAFSDCLHGRYLAGSGSGNPISVTAGADTSGVGVQLIAAAPTPLAAPVIFGTPQAGQTLLVSNGRWSGAKPMTFAYQWERCDGSGANCTAITGAKTNLHSVSAADIGHRLAAEVTATNTVTMTIQAATAVGPVTAAGGRAARSRGSRRTARRAKV